MRERKKQVKPKKGDLLKKLFYFSASALSLFVVALSALYLFKPWYDRWTLSNYYEDIYRTSLNYEFTCQTSEKDPTFKRIRDACEQSEPTEINMRKLMRADGYSDPEISKLIGRIAREFVESKKDHNEILKINP